MPLVCCCYTVWCRVSHFIGLVTSNVMAGLKQIISLPALSLLGNVGTVKLNLFFGSLRSHWRDNLHIYEMRSKSKYVVRVYTCSKNSETGKISVNWKVKGNMDLPIIRPQHQKPLAGGFSNLDPRWVLSSRLYQAGSLFWSYPKEPHAIG